MTPVGTLIEREMPANAAESPPATPSREEVEAREARRESLTAEMIRAARRADGMMRWESFFPAGLQASDWPHPGLAQ